MTSDEHLQSEQSSLHVASKFLLAKFSYLTGREMYLLCMDLRTTAIISLYRINWLVFTTEECVYCAVRTESLNIIPVNISP
jgi:hypothetical protein